jgi:hypothetical protein
MVAIAVGKLNFTYTLCRIYGGESLKSCGESLKKCGESLKKCGESLKKKEKKCEKCMKFFAIC